MSYHSSLRKLCLFAHLLIVLLLLTSCAPKIKGWSQEVYRSPDFDIRSLLNEEATALLPVIVVASVTAKERSGPTGPIDSAPYTPQVSPDREVEEKPSVTTNAHRITFSEALLSKIKSARPELTVVSPGDCLKRLNDAGLTARYLEFDRNFPMRGVDGALLKEFGHALGCRYLFISEAVVTDTKSDASVTVGWRFGRKSVLRSVKISGQIWDVVTGRQVWEGSGVGYNRLGAYEKTPLTEDMVYEAVERLFETIIPKEEK